VERHGTAEPDQKAARQAEVFARDMRLPESAPLVYLGRGEAQLRRPDARAGHLQWPLPTCSDRRLTTRGGPTVRDHFAHLASSNGPHEYQTLAHHTAKHLLGRAIAAALPEARVFLDTHAVDNGARPDVLVELPNGKQVAYEVQYAALTPDRWQERHDRYAQDGIRDVRLFGGPRFLRKLRSKDIGPDRRAGACTSRPAASRRSRKRCSCRPAWTIRMRCGAPPRSCSATNSGI
jgi:hypothetical protein